MKISAQNNRTLHALLNATGLIRIKEDLIFGETKGRTGSARELQNHEAINIIHYLKKQRGAQAFNAKKEAYVREKKQAQKDKDSEWQKCNRLRRVLIARSHTIGESVEFVKNWCEKYGANVGGKNIKKPFNDYNAQELGSLIEKFNRVRDGRIESVNEKIKAQIKR